VRWFAWLSVTGKPCLQSPPASRFTAPHRRAAAAGVRPVLWRRPDRTGTIGGMAGGSSSPPPRGVSAGCAGPLATRCQQPARRSPWRGYARCLLIDKRRAVFCGIRPRITSQIRDTQGADVPHARAGAGQEPRITSPDPLERRQRQGSSTRPERSASAPPPRRRCTSCSRTGGTSARRWVSGEAGSSIPRS
jgi:hypothetical protein